jgi:hypothetical protein
VGSLTGVRHSGNQIMAWNRHTRWVMVDFTVYYKLVWLAQEQNVPEREQHIVQSPEMMITIVWNPTSFHIVYILLKSNKLNLIIMFLLFCNLLQIDISVRSGDWSKTNCACWRCPISQGKVSLAFIEQNGMKIVLYSPHSKNLIQSDFLFSVILSRFSLVTFSNHSMTFVKDSGHLGVDEKSYFIGCFCWIDAKSEAILWCQ